MSYCFWWILWKVTLLIILPCSGLHRVLPLSIIDRPCAVFYRIAAPNKSELRFFSMCWILYQAQIWEKRTLDVAASWGCFPGSGLLQGLRWRTGGVDAAPRWGLQRGSWIPSWWWKQRVTIHGGRGTWAAILSIPKMPCSLMGFQAFSAGILHGCWVGGEGLGRGIVWSQKGDLNTSSPAEAGLTTAWPDSSRRQQKSFRSGCDDSHIGRQCALRSQRKPEAGKFERMGGYNVPHPRGWGHAPSGPGDGDPPMCAGTSDAQCWDASGSAPGTGPHGQPGGLWPRW